MNTFQNLKYRLNAVLFISAVYFIVWSLLVLVFPHALHAVIIENSSTSLVFWDMVGIITLILGFAMIIAAFEPYKNWLILLITFMFHIGIIIGFFVGYSRGVFSSAYFPFLVFNHVIWLVPLLIGLSATYRRNFFSDKQLIETFNSSDFPLEIFDTVQGDNLVELSERSPVLMVFLRHFGCPFCQNTLRQLSEQRQQIESKGVRLLLVYMSNRKVAADYLSQYHLDDVDQISDPESIVYKRFKLHRGSLNQLLGIKVLIGWMWLAISKKIFYKGVEGDIYQMPGIFLLHNGEIVKQYDYHTSADTPDYSKLLDYSF